MTDPSGKNIFLMPLYKGEKDCYNSQVKTKCAGGSMDRASDSGSEGWGFESLPAYQNSRYPNRVSGILFCRRGLEQLNANVRWTFAGWVGPQPHLTNISPSVRYLAPSPFRRLPEFKKVLVQMHFSKSPIRTFAPKAFILLRMTAFIFGFFRVYLHEAGFHYF